MNNFTAMKTSRKGAIGERIVFNILSKLGFAIYQPVNDVAHLVDYLTSRGGTLPLQAVEVKTYPRLYAAAYTGIDKKYWECYNELLTRHAIHTRLYFVDEVEACVYGQYVSNLLSHATIKANKLCFPLAKMKVVRKLSEGEVKAIKKHSSTDYELYNNVRRCFS